MKLRKSELVTLILTIAFFTVGSYFYPQLPEEVASHWNAEGVVDDYMGRFWGTFLMPFISLGLFFIFLIVPRIDPRRNNIEKFRRHFDLFIIALFIFLFYLYLITIAWNLNQKFNFVQAMVPAFALFFYILGAVISKAKSNWTIGIRTPWTLSSESVWDKTHSLGGKLFKAVAAISLAGFFFPKNAFWFFLAPVIVASAYSVIYSYVIYKKESRTPSSQ